jgi:hypothetical protein
MNYRKALLNNNEEVDTQIYSDPIQLNENTNQTKNKKRKNRNKNKKNNVELQNNVEVENNVKVENNDKLQNNDEELNKGFIEVKSRKKIRNNNNKNVVIIVDKNIPEYKKWINCGITHNEYCKYINKLKNIDDCLCCFSYRVEKIIKRDFRYNCHGCCCCDPSWYM